MPYLRVVVVCFCQVNGVSDILRDREEMLLSFFNEKRTPLEHGARRSAEVSRQEPVDLGPHLGRIVIVGSVDLPSRASLSLSLRGAPVNYGLMCLPQPRIGSPMHGHRRLPSGQG